MQDARLEISALGIDALKALPPMIWCTNGGLGISVVIG